jgi:hypothetical protein
MRLPRIGLTGATRIRIIRRPEITTERMMTLRKLTFVLLGLCALPGVAPAGPIEFNLSTGNIQTSPWAPELGMTFRSFQSNGQVFTFDPTSNQPVALPAVLAIPGLLPAPAALDIHPDGTTHWNNEGNFSVDVSLTDRASGQSATLTFMGYAHTFNNYSTSGGWTGNTYYYFLGGTQVTLGGNLYTIWATDQYDSAPGALWGPNYSGASAATVDVWVGANPPVNLFSPEPGTIALVALGLVPLGLRRLGRMRGSRSDAACCGV